MRCVSLHVAAIQASPFPCSLAIAALARRPCRATGAAACGRRLPAPALRCGFLDQPLALFLVRVRKAGPPVGQFGRNLVGGGPQQQEIITGAKAQVLEQAERRTARCAARSAAAGPRFRACRTRSGAGSPASRSARRACRRSPALSAGMRCSPRACARSI